MSKEQLKALTLQRICVINVNSLPKVFELHSVLVTLCIHLPSSTELLLQTNLLQIV